MGLKLQNEFTVAAPLDKTWDTLLDIGRVAGCMPGAKLESGGEDGVYRGGMKVKLGPMNVAYEGTARLAEVDADTHVSTIAVKAKEARGQGTASATITNRLVADGASTKVIVETDLAITGRQAQFGRGIMEDIASKMLADFAKRLEREVLAGPAASAAAPSLPATPGAGATATATASPSPFVAPAITPVSSSSSGGAVAAGDDDSDVLDLGNVVSGPLAKRAGMAVAGALVLSTLLWLLGRRRTGKGLEVTLRYR